MLVDGGGDGLADGAGSVAAEFLGASGAARIALLGGADDAVHHRDHFDGMPSDGGLAGEHERVGAVPDRIGDIGGFSASWPGAGGHRFQHLGGNDHGIMARPAAAMMRRWATGTSAGPTSTPRSPAGDHRAVGGGDDRGQVRDRGDGLDFGDQRDFAVGGVDSALGFGEVVGAADEREGEEVDAVLDGEADVCAVLDGDGGELLSGAGGVESGRVP